MSSPTLTFVPASQRYPTLAGETDYFIALDGETQVGNVRLADCGPEIGRWQWSLLPARPEPLFPWPTNGTARSKAEAVGELVECWRAFRAWFGIA